MAGLVVIGMPDDLIESVARGIDLFDCVLPTRNARNGQLLTRRGPIPIKNAKYAEDLRPPDPDCPCPTCRRHSRADVLPCGVQRVRKQENSTMRNGLAVGVLLISFLFPVHDAAAADGCGAGLYRDAYGRCHFYRAVETPRHACRCLS